MQLLHISIYCNIYIGHVWLYIDRNKNILNKNVIGLQYYNIHKVLSFIVYMYCTYMFPYKCEFIVHTYMHTFTE